ncbi:MAG: hypothetical protein WCB96_07010 [Candidatus Aminicenantales bacterium]
MPWNLEERGAGSALGHFADWPPGDKVIFPPPGSCGQAQERVDGAGQDYKCLDWFLCFKSLP